MGGEEGGVCESTANGYDERVCVYDRTYVCEEARQRASSARTVLQSTNKSSQEERKDLHVLYSCCNVNEDMLQ